jgi:parvulin-like peptidyl-prolyl isomerase
MTFSFVRRPVLDSTSLFPVWPALLLAGAALLAGCHPAVTDPNDPKFIVAEKGTWKITQGELDEQVNNYLKGHQMTPSQVGPSKMPMLETAMLKSLVLKRLLLDKAAALPPSDLAKDEAAELDRLKGPAPEAEFEEKLKSAGLTLDELKQKIHEKLLINKVLEADAFKNVDPTDQEINDIYLKNKESFNIPEKVRASRILIHVDDTASAPEKAAKKKEIDQARNRVMKGEDFGKVASEVSEDRSSAPNGGDLGFFQRGVNESGFDDVAFITKQNAVSPVFLTPLGYQFLKVTTIQPAGIVPVADARGYITSKLREMKMQQQEQAFAQALLADSGVTYHRVLVDPPAQTAPTGSGGPGPDSAPPSGAPDSGAPPPSGADSPPQTMPAQAPGTNGAPSP